MEITKKEYMCEFFENNDPQIIFAILNDKMAYHKYSGVVFHSKAENIVFIAPIFKTKSFNSFILITRV